MSKSQAMSEQFERQVKNLTERNETLARTNERLENVIVEGTHLMKKTRTDQIDTGTNTEHMENEKNDTKEEKDSKVDRGQLLDLLLLF